MVVYPATAEDVSKTLLFSRAQGLDLAVVGGGHGTSGAASTDGGLVIDLSRMRAVAVDKQAMTVTAEGGCLWSDVDREAAKYGLAAVGGTVNHTGVGGLTLGGGYGYLTPRVGMVIDNLLAAELVLADGSLVTASEEENRDLFWAARGAGVGFGVFTKFTYRAHEQRETVWGGVLAYAREHLDVLIRFGNEVLVDESGKTLMLLGFAAPPPAHQPVRITFLSPLPRSTNAVEMPPSSSRLTSIATQVVLVVLFYNGTEAEGKAYYEPLLRLSPLTNNTSTLPYPAANEMLNVPMAPGLRRTLKGSAFLAPLDTTFAARLFSEYVSFITAHPDAGAAMILLEFFPYKKILAVAQTATAFANRGAYGNIAFGPGWTREENDGLCREWTRKMSVIARRELERRIRDEEGVDEVTRVGVGEYANYDSLGAGGREVFGVNYKRLVGLKKKYDPENVFSKGPSLVE